MVMEKSKVVLLECYDYDVTKLKKSLKKGLKLLNFDFSKLKKSIFLKPNLCLPVEPCHHITTNPLVLDALIQIIHEESLKDIVIGDTAIGSTSQRNPENLWKKTGLSSLNCERTLLNDLSHNIKIHHINIDNLDFPLPISDDIFSSHVINIPKFKTHGYMMLSGCVKNLYGILSGDSKKLFHKIAQNKTRFAKLLLEIYNKVDCKLHIVDGIWGIEGDGPGVKGIPKKINLIALSQDGIALDHILAEIMGVPSHNIPTNFYSEFNKEILLLGDPIENFKKHQFQLPLIDDHQDRIVEYAIKLKRSQIYIDRKHCKICGMCVKNCPMEALKKTKNGIEINKNKCINCLVCMETCLHGAVLCKRIPLFI